LFIDRLACWFVVGALLSVVACGDDTDDAATASAGGGADAGAGGSTSSSATGAGGGSCKTAGELCGPEDHCNAWTCHCLNSTTDFDTLGWCEDGICSSGEKACESICAPNGGVMEAIDGGCF
jgi:hypothetical protein